MGRLFGPWEPYPDQGCHMAPRCLTCPLPICIHDAEKAGYGQSLYQTGIRDIALLQRYHELIEGDLTKKSPLIVRLAGEEHQTKRAIWRRLKNGRKWVEKLQWTGLPKGQAALDFSTPT